MRQKKDNIPADAGHFLRTKIDSTDFRKENVALKIAEKRRKHRVFFKKIFQNILKQTKPSIEIST